MFKITPLRKKFKCTKIDILNVVPTAPSNVILTWVNDYLHISFTINAIGNVRHEVWESINGGAYTLLTTLNYGINTYDHYSLQGVTVAILVRAKIFQYSGYAPLQTINTPLVWRTNQSVLTAVTITELYVDVGSNIYLNWGDGSALQLITGTTVNIIHNYISSGQYYIAMSGNLDKIYRFLMYNQSHLYGDLTKWVLSGYRLGRLRIYGCSFSGDISDWVINPASTLLFGNDFIGKIPEATASVGAAGYDINDCLLSGSNLTEFRINSSTYDFSDQRTSFPTDEIDKLLKAMADFYEDNTPIGNLSMDLRGNYMAVPTGGDLNVDKVRTENYFTTAGLTATILVNSPVPFLSPKLMITFDGNIESLYSVNFPILTAKGAKATYYSWTDNIGIVGAYTWANCLEMFTAGMDIQDHSKDHVRMTLKSSAELHADFVAVNNAFLANGLPVPDHIAYPYGSSNALVESVTTMYRLTGRKYTPDVWLIWKNLTKLAVPCYTIDGVDIEDIKDVLDSAIASNALVVTLNHAGNATQLADLIDYAQAGGMDIITVTEMYALL